ncbi:MAG TPA: 2'-5' RNA ligase family protein [Firmicutes bacterium]|nr:2'-5' RNA ligase family protein [Bacillota bacterium]
MPYAIELYLDKKGANAVEQIHLALRENGITVDWGTKPHVSLCIYEDLPIGEFEAALKLFAGEIAPFEVTFSNVDAFQTERPVVFLAPKVTPELAAVHRKFHDYFRQYSDTAWHYYKPGVWIPHCTLGMNLSQDMYLRAMEILKGVQLPIKATFESVGILKFHPNEQLSVFDLG